LQEKSYVIRNFLVVDMKNSFSNGENIFISLSGNHVYEYKKNYLILS